MRCDLLAAVTFFNDDPGGNMTELLSAVAATISAGATVLVAIRKLRAVLPR
jgi:hypothetical protein